jgi:hypothetical protein|tara:strand:+ start:582 stop:1001 length:420 start_codon:yes stop_codon:yes gene_type:complete
MIDIDKYEGHTPGPWEWSKSGDAGNMRLGTAGVDKRRKEFNESVVMGDRPPHPAARPPERRLWGSLSDANKLLITDAPLLLAEVKRLRKALAYTASLLTCRMEGDDIPTVHIREYALDVVDMTVDEAMATTHLMGDEEE